ncbi:ATP-binding cassette domain-containing protein [Clavibacter tessellarius]|uniref:ATP-binding cassette domain-containing protein n=1 Tax=Clavibacter tessellarius TaxID=31965 RepID=UPI003246E4E6
MIQISHLVKRRRGRTHVDDVSFDVQPGRVTGLLGPNGAGKSLHDARAARARRGHLRHRAHRRRAVPRPPRSPADGRRDARRARREPRPHRRRAPHLDGAEQRDPASPRRRGPRGRRPPRRAAHPRRQPLLGMGQRLGIAAALLGDPQILVLDEPTNGLDPDGIRWIRRFLRGMADEGRTVLVSSHLMSEMEDTADDFVVIARGRVVAQGGSAEITTGFHSLESAFFALTEGGADHRSGDVASRDRA